MGTQPMLPLPKVDALRPVGSRLPLAYARATGANFVTPGALAAVRARSTVKEPHQSIDVQRLWADLLWAPAAAFNLFGDLAADPALADRAVHTWWPDAPGRVGAIRFTHSPGRLDQAYLGNLVSFDAAVELDTDHAARAIVGVQVKYHDRRKRERPKPERLLRYVEVMDRSGAFAPGALDAVNGTDLLELWLAHLLVLSMVQHPSGTWRWGRFVLVHAAANTDYVEAVAHYRSLLVDPSTFASVTVEDLLDAGALPAASAAALRRRYLP